MAKPTLEALFAAALAANREAAAGLGVRIRPIEAADGVRTAKRTLAGSRTSDGFSLLAQKGRLDLSLEALAVKKQFTELFTDDEVNEALMRLLDGGYSFR